MMTSSTSSMGGSTTGLRIGIDLGGTKIEAIALDRSGQVLARPRIAAPRDDYEATLTAICGLVTGIEDQLGVTGSVGIGIPGAISPATGTVKNANSLWLNGKALDRDLSQRLDRPVRAANDANCLAVSEATDGAAAGAETTFAAILGTGVGGGIAFHGRVLTGRNAIAGEWGHTPLPWPTPGEYPGSLCYCGRTGCIETWLSGPAASNEFERLTGERLRMTDIAERARAGAIAARNYLDLYTARLARALSVIVDILDPDAIVLGGGVSNVAHIYEALPELLSSWCFSDTVSTPVIKAMHNDSSGVRGAAWLWPVN